MGANQSSQMVEVKPLKKVLKEVKPLNKVEAKVLDTVSQGKLAQERTRHVGAQIRYIEELTNSKKYLQGAEAEAFVRLAIAIMNNLRLQVENGDAPMKNFTRILELMKEGGIKMKTKKLEMVDKTIVTADDSSATTEEYRMMPRREMYEPMGFNLR
jgi:hypothetical protein